MSPAPTETRAVGSGDGPGRRSPAARYGLAVVVVGLAAAVKWLLDPALEAESPFLLFVVAIAVGAWFGGLVPGLFATGLALVVCDYLFLGPPFALGIDGPGRFFDLALFCAVGVGVSALVASMHAERLRSAASERRFRLIVQGAKDYAILMLSPDGRVKSWNDGARRILGYEEGEILGEHFSVFYTPEDRREDIPDRELRRAVAGRTVSEERWAVRKDGSRLWANGSTEPIRDGRGNLEGVVKVLRDRTEAKHAEEELRLKDRAMTASADGILITDPNEPDNPIVYVNPAFTRITGYAPEEAIGRNCRFLQGDDNDQPGLEELRAAIREGRTCEVVLRNYRKDGALFYNELSLSPVFDDGGGIIRFVGILEDITERRRAEEGLRVQAEASEILATPLSYEERLASLAHLVVPRLADWCAVDIVEENGSVHRLAVEHQDPEKVALAYELQRRYPTPDDARRGVPEVLRTGEPEMMRQIPEELLRQSVGDGQQLHMLRELGLRSYMIVPMIARGRTLGAITLVSAESGRLYGPGDLEQAETLVRRAAMVVDNARLYEEARREIAERERAQEELRQSEDRLRLATETTRLGTFDFDPVTGELHWDARCKEIFGLPPDAEVDQETFLAGLHPDDRERVDRAGRRALDPSPNGEYELEYRVVGLGDGEERWVEARGRTFFEGGRAVRFIGTVLDVTEKKRAAEALKRSEERYRAVIEQSTEGIYLLDTVSRRLLETNPAFQRMFGYTAEELKGMEIYDLVAHSRENVDANVWRTLELGRVLIGERSYKRKDGTVVEVEIGASIISYNGQKAICALVRDITARKRAEDALRRSEERFRALVRYASDMIVILDRDGEILYESPAVERILGFTVEERVGTNSFDYLHPEDREPVARRFAELVRQPGGRISAEYRVHDKTGDWRFFEAMGVNMLEDPVISGVVVNLRDVTERRRTEQALEEIREAERGRMARELHDGVLQDLSYAAQTLEIISLKYAGTDVEKDLQESAETMRRASRDLRGAIYDIRAQRDGTQDARQLFESLVNLNRRRMLGCNLVFDLQDGLLEQLSERGGTELLRIVQEALTNVRRHSGADEANVAFSSHGDTLRAEISDNGQGFDPEVLPPGMGTLGMRERTLGLGGKLEIESEPGAGTTVRIEVPLENLRR
ncbi:MAG TPA: PAS domain S-box protein [Rubrobacter sp.]|nr:PAS domain S-box protein [Rubrobacter sp.]